MTGGRGGEGVGEWRGEGVTMLQEKERVMNGNDVYEFETIEPDVCSACGQRDSESDQPYATIDDLIIKLELALRYLDHPDVQAMNFALGTEVVAKRIRKSIAKAREASDG